MNKTLSLIARAYQDPLSRISLAVDLLPILAIFAFGWGAAPLVALYWLENLVIGAFTLLRMVSTGFYNRGMFALFLFTGPFFCVHYGIFCYGHGLFLRTLSAPNDPGTSFTGLIEWALASGPWMPAFLAAIIAVNAAYFALDYIGRGEAAKANPFAEMFMPYDRIITLHVAIILGTMLTLGLGQPLLGVLLLLTLRVAYGLLQATRRRKKRDAQLAEGVELATV
ncbi:DUF6498-containing protein [Hyphomonas sp. WL0036]|uniref:DUF6498-containing protein n=1 Tax=Hyphomonas sediminis TaxID=2866160 RepID=UPI001C7F69CF|nr:DUF6498-containing protein [Hyphomonas sediminis]MBY9066575.1 DUF6498-containing protein [Hyphomonas sediminis]